MSELQVFDRVLVGVDATDYGFEALHQALALAHEGTAVQAVTALDLPGVLPSGWDPTGFREVLRAQAEEARAKAVEILAGRLGSVASLVRGSAQTVLRQGVGAFLPTLLVLGGRRRSPFFGRWGATAADLVIEGSRGLHCVRALGSVSERVATMRGARCWSCERLVLPGAA